MMHFPSPRSGRSALALLCVLTAAGCAGRVPASPALPSAPPLILPVEPIPATPSGTPVVLERDLIAELVGTAEHDIALGESALAAGRLAAAREHFDQAVDRLMQHPSGVRGDARLSSEFDRLIDRISALDVLALRDGDGFTESRTEPAAIDELLLAATFDRPVPAAITAESVAEDLAETPHDYPITINEKVLSYVELFQGRLRDFMQAGLNRSVPYLPMIQATFQQAGLPADLAFVPLVESGFKNTALSRVSARGMWQFMAGTGLEHGLDQTWFIDERSDPELATQAAAQYLSSLYKMFDGDWNLALASYNAGPGRLQRAVRTAKTNDYWKLTSSTRYLPRETREYVPMIQAAMIIARNPTRYGFEVPVAPPLAYERVSVPDALDLRVIAEWIGVTTEALAELNPHLRRTTTPMGAHEIKVPLGTAATVEERLLTVDRSLFKTFKFHTVRARETVTTIAKKYGLKVADLREANHLTAKSKLRTNQVLNIPERAAAALPTAAARPAAKPTTPQAPKLYTVRRGDTLSSIARQFDTTVPDLKRLNQLSRDTIVVGDRLTVRR